MRSVWKGHIRFSLVTIPIQVFSAVETKNNISFNQLHKEDNGRVGYKKTCKSCNEVLKPKDIVKGYEYEPDQYVVLTKDELSAVKLKSTRAIDIEAFVDISEVHPSRFEAVYFVGPDGDVAKQPFQLFLQTIKKSNKAGIGRIILRDREDVVVMVPEGSAIIMYKLRYPYELRDITKVPDTEEIEVDESQLKLAQTLVDSLATTFEEIDFEDRYHEALMELVNKKIEGEEIVTAPDTETSTPTVNIMDALKASIEQSKNLKKGA